MLGRLGYLKKQTIRHNYTNETTFTHKDKKFVLHPLNASQVEEDQGQMIKKREKERDDTCTHQSEINCSKCQSSTHKTNECPNKRVPMLKVKGLCGDSKEVFFQSSSSKMERQDQIRPCGEK